MKVGCEEGAKAGCEEDAKAGCEDGAKAGCEEGARTDCEEDAKMGCEAASRGCDDDDVTRTGRLVIVTEGRISVTGTGGLRTAMT
jgi:hypothetical protein